MRFVPALALSLLAFPAFAGPAADAVGIFYAPDAVITDPALRDRFTDPALDKLKQYDREAENDMALDCIDFALQYDAQDLDDAEVARTLKLDETLTATGDTASVVATFNLFAGEPESRRSIRWSLKKVGDAWKISDIAAAGGEWRLSDFACE